jgi:DNA repair protein
MNDRLSEEQLERIKENRKQAIKRLEEGRKRKEAEKLVQAQTSVVPLAFCEHVYDGEPCGHSEIDQYIFETFNEKVCKICKSRTDAFDLLNKGEAMTKYLVSNDAFQSLNFASKSNPHNNGWIPMKLYLRKHILALALRKFGSLESMEAEKQIRQASRLERDMKRTQLELKQSMSEYNIVLGEAIEGRKHAPNSEQASGKESQQSKRRKSMLGDFISIIKGK